MGMLWFDKPAETWSQALPIGNGRLGAMVFGGGKSEILQLNQDSIWYGGPMDRVNPDAREHLEEVRELILAGRIPEAENLLRYTFSGTPRGERPYQPLGNLELTFHGIGKELPEYRRELDLEKGIVTEEYALPGHKIRKEYLASFPHGVIAIHMEAKEGSISLDALLRRAKFYDHAGKLDERTIAMDAVLGEGGVSFLAAVRAQAVGGEVKVLGEHLLVREAKELTLFIGCETSYYEKDWKEAVRNSLDKACGDGYACVKERHVEDYQALFGRVTLEIEEEGAGAVCEREAQEASGAVSEDMQGGNLRGKAHRGDIPIDKRMEAGKEEGFDGAFAALYFQYGRYLLISSSRPGSLPANLQGIWNEEMQPPWDSKFTININTEMNYWPAEMCSLPECHLPLFTHLLRMQEKGKDAAERMYGCRGFVAHHNTDLWGDCAPQDIYIPATYWVMGGAWLCTHIWMHYAYTGEEEFLKVMYPLLKDAVLFFHDYLIEVDGKLVTCPSVSPENTYILPDGVRGCVCAGSSMDNQILRDLLEGYLKASKALGIRDGVVEKSEEILRRLPETRIGKYGQIMEWMEDYEEANPGHRHISQLYALHPSHQITVDKTPELAEAASKTLERRLAHGGGHTGWSCAWIVNLYARLGDGEKALQNLQKLWSQSTFPNLTDTHPRGKGHTFQIDGNLGATAAIAEMLVQSDEDRVLLLPALPKQWAKGRMTGLTICGGAKIDVEWEAGRLKACWVRSRRAMEVVLVYGREKKEISMTPGAEIRVEWS